MARIWTIWFWRLDPDKHSCFLYWVSFYLTNVFSLPPQSVMLWGGGVSNLGERQVCQFTQFLELCSAQSVRA